MGTNLKRKLTESEKLEIDGNVKKWEILRNTGRITMMNRITENQKKEIIKTVKSEGLKEKNGILYGFANPKNNRYIAEFAVLCMVYKGMVNVDKVVVADYDEAISKIRGFGNDRPYVDELFSKKNHLIFLEGIRKSVPSDNQNNVDSFWKRLLDHLEKNKNIYLVGWSIDRTSAMDSIFTNGSKMVEKRFTKANAER